MMPTQYNPFTLNHQLLGGRSPSGPQSHAGAGLPEIRVCDYQEGLEGLRV